MTLAKLSSDQQIQLEQFYSRCQYPNRYDEIANDIGVEKSLVKRWFIQKRAKSRREREKKEPQIPATPKRNAFILPKGSLPDANNSAVINLSSYHHALPICSPPLSTYNSKPSMHLFYPQPHFNMQQTLTSIPEPLMPSFVPSPSSSYFPAYLSLNPYYRSQYHHAFSSAQLSNLYSTVPSAVANFDLAYLQNLNETKVFDQTEDDVEEKQLIIDESIDIESDERDSHSNINNCTKDYDDELDSCATSNPIANIFHQASLLTSTPIVITSNEKSRKLSIANDDSKRDLTLTKLIDRLLGDFSSKCDANESGLGESMQANSANLNEPNVDDQVSLRCCQNRQIVETSPSFSMNHNHNLRIKELETVAFMAKLQMTREMSNGSAHWKGKGFGSMISETNKFMPWMRPEQKCHIPPPIDRI